MGTKALAFVILPSYVKDVKVAGTWRRVGKVLLAAKAILTDVSEYTVINQEFHGSVILFSLSRHL